MRIIAGKAKSIKLRCPSGPGVRPTTDMIRESLFASLGPDVVGARFADLYAGSGSVGLEALSRGAGFALFVEKERACLQALFANLANSSLADHAVVMRGDVAGRWRAAWRRHGPFDIVFVDPPYGFVGLAELLRRLVQEGEGVRPGGLVIVQHDAADELGLTCAPAVERRWGASRVTTFRFSGKQSDDE